MPYAAGAGVIRARVCMVNSKRVPALFTTLKERRSGVMHSIQSFCSQQWGRDQGCSFQFSEVERRLDVDVMLRGRPSEKLTLLVSGFRLLHRRKKLLLVVGDQSPYFLSFLPPQRLGGVERLEVKR